MLVSDLIKASLRKLTVYASGESPSSNELADGLTALQSMLRRWSTKKILVFASVREYFVLVPGTYFYTWGSGGTWNTTRPHRLLGAYIVDSSEISHTVAIIDETKRNSITAKTTISRPYTLFMQPAYPLAFIYLYPIPDTAEELHIISIKPFTETSSFSATSDTISFPSEYEEALIYNLAVRLASEFGKTVPVEVAAIAEGAYNDIIKLNSGNQVESIDLLIPSGSPLGTRYSINSDSYH